MQSGFALGASLDVVQRRHDRKDAVRGADPESTGITLNTESETNLPCYEKAGFRKGCEADAGPLHTWSFYWPCD
jgi:hypothetical protein